MLRAADLAAFLARNPAAIVAELTRVRGSSPREAGTFMLIAESETIETIGGGALEHLVIARARQVLRNGLANAALEVSLGPEIGQCCGGRVDVGMRVVDEAARQALVNRLKREEAGQPEIFVFGAGHVGRALARTLVLLPVKTTVIDTRVNELHGLPEGVTARATAMPEALVRQAPKGTAYVIVTHDHALDFLIAQEALARADAPYVGMIGSRTKKAKFAHWYKGEGGDPEVLNRLVMPIGQQGLASGKGTGDKRPEVIAVLAAAEIMVHIGGREDEGSGARPVTGGEVDTVDGR
jgi:xanthine dehydrogenase accessory factor